MAEIAAESGHYYTRDGAPAYEVASAKGAMRPTTVRDARKFGLIPSVTTIARLQHQGGLVRWINRQFALAGSQCPRADDQPLDDWMREVEERASAISKEASETGTAIHAAIERRILAQPPDPTYAAHADAAIAAVAAATGVGMEGWEPERSFANLQHGFAGKLDLSGEWGVVDFKSKDSLDGVKAYDSHAIQLAAYQVGMGLWGRRGGICFVSREKPEAVFVEVPAADLERGWEIFGALLTLWRAVYRYDPRAV